MSSWVDAITSPLKAASETAQEILSIRDQIKLGETVIKLHGQILAAQQGASAAQTRELALLEEIGASKRRIAELETWEAEKQRYELVALAPNVVAYSIKEAMRGSEPAHYICADCYQRGEKRFLQQEVRGSHLDKFACHSCKSELMISKGKPIDRPHKGPSNF